MGGAKTAQAIIAAQFLHDLNVIDRVIVVAPAEIRRTVWFSTEIGQLVEQVFESKNNYVTEFHAKLKNWQRGPKTKIQCSRCSTPLRDKDQDHPGICTCGGFLDDVPVKELRWIITNYEFIRGKANLAVLLPYCGPRTFLILDESSSVRGCDSAQTDACMKLRWLTTPKGRPVLGAARCGRILEMNGTPLAEGPMDLFSQGNLLHPSILACKYVTHYRARYAVQAPVLGSGGVMMSPYTQKVKQPDGSYKRIPKPIQQTVGWTEEGLKDLQQRFAPYILRREAKDFGVDFALPPVALEVKLTPETWKHYVSMRDQMVAWLEGGVVHASQAGTKSMRLSQITSGFLGGLEDIGFDDSDSFDDDASKTLWDDLGPAPDYVVARAPLPPSDVAHPPIPRGQVVEVGREKLDFALAWHAEMLRRHPDLKLLSWWRFVPELKRYLREVAKLTPEVGAACGAKVIEDDRSKREEREHAMRLLNPKTTPPGAATLGATQGTGAMGLNFTACRTVLEGSFGFEAWKKKQGDARTNRTGQTGMVSYFYLLAVGPKGQKTIDHHVYLQRTGKITINDWTTAAWVRALKEE